MKKLTILLLLLPFFGFAQNLTISELISLRTKTPGQVESFLTDRSWELISSKKDEEGSVEIVYTYGRSATENKANGFFQFSYGLDGSKVIDWNKNVICYQIHALSIFKKLNLELRKLGYKEVNYVVGEGRVTRYYKSVSGKTYIEVSSIVEESGDSFMSQSTIYTFTIWPPEYYRLLSDIKQKDDQ